MFFMSMIPKTTTDIRNIRPNGKTPDKIYRIIDGEAVEIKKAYRIINDEAVVVWDVGSEPPVPPPFIIGISYFRMYSVVTQTGGRPLIIISHPEQAGGGHAGEIDWDDGRGKISFDSKTGGSAVYPSRDEYHEIMLECSMTMIKPVLDYSYSTWVFYKQNFHSFKLADTVKLVGGYTFNQCTFMYNIFPKEEAIFDFNMVETIESDCFYESFRKIYTSDVPNIVLYMPEVKTIGSAAFSGGSSSLRSGGVVKTAIMPKVEEIGGGAFYTTGIIGEISMPKIKTIDDRAFASTKIEKVYIGADIESIDSRAFEYCNSLTEIRIDKPVNSVSGAPWGATNANIVWLG